MPRKMSTVSSESTEQPNQIQLRNVSGLETTTDQESNNTSSKSKQTTLPTSELQMDQLFNIDGIKYVIINHSKLYKFVLYSFRNKTISFYI